MNIQFGQITELPESFKTLAAQARGEGFLFLDRMYDEWVAGINRFDKPGECLLLARDGPGVVGVAGLNQDPYIDDPDIGRIRHFYIAADYRGSGVGRQLLQELLNRSGCFDQLRLFTSNPVAASLYEGAGFRSTDETKASHYRDLAPN